MKQTLFRWIFAGGLMLALGCSNVEPSDDTEGKHGETDDTESDIPDAGDDSSGAPSGVCVVLELNLHEGSGQALVDLSTMTVSNEDVSQYDFAMVNQMPDPPAIFLGPKVTAANLGNEATFEEVTDAPADGYAADGDIAVIGMDWRTGGNGTDGHTVSGNVYAFKTADGHYAKISVTSAKQGLATIDAYFQADGSTDLECAFGL